MTIITNVLKPFTFTKSIRCFRPKLPGKPWVEGEDLLLARVSLVPGVLGSTPGTRRVEQMFTSGAAYC